MDITSIVVALIAAAGGAITSILTAGHNVKTLTYRIDQLEKKVDVYSAISDKVLLMQQEVQVIREAMDKLGHRVAVHGEQLDNAYTLAEKNESRITALERNAIERRA